MAARFLIVILIIAGALAYLRFEDTRTWNQYLTELGVPKSTNLYVEPLAPNPVPTADAAKPASTSDSLPK
jgi:hypothetical protein